MEFKVDRTSVFTFDEKPCEEAYIKEFVKTQELSKKVRKLSPNDEWYTDKRYFNHREENGKYLRDYIEKVWFVKIDTLEELLNFVDKNKNQIVLYYDKSNDIQDIEIYDTWRE